jgi:hypothetical protein
VLAEKMPTERKVYVKNDNAIEAFACENVWARPLIRLSSFYIFVKYR